MENNEFEKMFEKLCKVGVGGKKSMKLFVKHPDQKAAIAFLLDKIKDYLSNFENYREDERLKFGINYAIQILGTCKATESIDLLIEVAEKGIYKIPGMFTALAELSLVSIGEPAIEPLYKKYNESTGNPQMQSLWLGILGQIDTKDKRIHDAILKCFEEDPLAAIRIVDDCLDLSFLPAVKNATKKAADYLKTHNINPLLYSGDSDIPEVEVFNIGRDLWVNLEIGFAENEAEEAEYFDRIEEIDEELFGLKGNETDDDNDEQEPDETGNNVLKFENKVGRNDPCPCGSSKKYKKCCMKKDEEKIQSFEDYDGFEEKYEDDKEESNSKNDYFDAFYEKYERSSLNNKIKMLEQFTEQGEPIPEYYLVVNEVVNPLMRKGKYQEVLSLIDYLKEKNPLSYSEDDSWFEEIRIESILKLGSGDLTAPLAVFAKKPEEHIDEFIRVGDMLMYYGRTSELVQAMITAWPDVEKSDKIWFDGIPLFQDRIYILLLLDYIKTGGLEPEKDNNFIQLTKPYTDSGNDWLERVCRFITGREDTRWTIEDFDNKLDHLRNSN